jgi:hypothetical protein
MPKKEIARALPPALQNWETEWLFNKTEWTARFGKEGKPFIGGVIEDVGASTMADLAVGVDFDIESPAVIQFQKKFIKKYSKEVNKTTLNKLKKTLQEGIREGESIPKLRKRVSKVFDFATRQRALQISRSETIRASNFATEEAFIQSGVVTKKTWYAALDERLCPFCHELHDRTIELKKNFLNQGDTFTVGEESLSVDYADVPYPPAHVFCRCTIIAEIE